MSPHTVDIPQFFEGNFAKAVLPADSISIKHVLQRAVRIAGQAPYLFHMTPNGHYLGRSRPMICDVAAAQGYWAFVAHSAFVTVCGFCSLSFLASSIFSLLSNLINLNFEPYDFTPSIFLPQLFQWVYTSCGACLRVRSIQIVSRCCMWRGRSISR